MAEVEVIVTLDDEISSRLRRAKLQFMQSACPAVNFGARGVLKALGGSGDSADVSVWVESRAQAKHCVISCLLHKYGAVDAAGVAREYKAEIILPFDVVASERLTKTLAHGVRQAIGNINAAIARDAA